MADSDEHAWKRTDVRTLRAPTQQRPLYLHSPAGKNQKVATIDDPRLKPVAICANCNNNRTQPHDKAWEKMSAWMRSHDPPLAAGDIISLDDIFPDDTEEQLKNLQLFFVKTLGCRLVGTTAEALLPDLAKAIMSDAPHPRVRLAFGVAPVLPGNRLLNHGHVTGFGLGETGPSASAAFTYQIDTVAVRTLVVAPGLPELPPHPEWPDAWDPASTVRRRTLVQL